MSCEFSRVLDMEGALKIKNWGERVFACSCLAKGNLKVEYQVPINGKTGSVIDFRITNLKSRRSRLVGVTETPRSRVLGSERKERQIRNLKLNGEPFSIVALENLIS